MHFERFYAHHADSAFMQRNVMTVSEQPRPVPLLLLGNRDAKQHIVLTARHHSCESAASYLLEGLLEYFLQSGASPVLDRFLIHAVPFIDIDGVENGDQGKHRIPHDHNNDYRDTPLYRSTVALMEYARQLRLVAAVDFHCPYKWGKRNDWNFPRDTMCSRFFSRMGARLACTFEFPYFGAERPYTIPNMRNFGKDFACALESYLSKK